MDSKTGPKMCSKTGPKMDSKLEPKLNSKTGPGRAKAPRTLSGFWGGFFYNVVPEKSKTCVGKNVAHHPEKIENTTATNIFILFWRKKYLTANKKIIYFASFFSVNLAHRAPRTISEIIFWHRKLVFGLGKLLTII